MELGRRMSVSVNESLSTQDSEFKAQFTTKQLKILKLEMFTQWRGCFPNLYPALSF